METALHGMGLLQSHVVKQPLLAPQETLEERETWLAELTLFTVLSIDFKTGAAAFSFFMWQRLKY